MPAPIAAGETGASARSKINTSFTDFSSHSGAGGAVHANVVAAGAAGFMTGTDKTKLDGIAAGATANSADATLLSRANHTGTQLASTVSDFAEAVDDRVAALLVQGSNVTLTYNDAANTLTIAAAGGAGATNLGYTASTRLLTSDTGTDVTLPLLTSTDAGLAPASGGGTTNFLRADGTWVAPAGSGTVTSVGMSVPTGLSLSGSPVTSSGTLAVTLTAGYVIPTQAALDAKLDASIASDITATKTLLVAADKIIALDSAASDTPKLTTIAQVANSLARLAPGSSLATTGTVNLDMAALAGTFQTITASGNITFTTSNLAAGQTLRLRIGAGGATRTLTWPAWIAYGAALPTSLASGKVLRVALESTGTTDGGVDAVAVESA